MNCCCSSGPTEKDKVTYIKLTVTTQPLKPLIMQYRKRFVECCLQSITDVFVWLPRLSLVFLIWFAFLVRFPSKEHVQRMNAAEQVNARYVHFCMKMKTKLNTLK